MKTDQKHISFGLSVIPLLVMFVSMGFTIIVFEGSPHIPLIVGTVVAAFIAWRAGFTWKEIEAGLYKGIRLALPAIVIIIMVGVIIGAWIGGGIIATMVYYGLKLISPPLFLVSITVITAIVSLAIGSSWSTMGTIGVAGMGIGISMGIPAPMVAGAIISGAYFGDKMSPLSDSTNLAAGITGVDLFEHIKHMLYTTIPGFVIALVFYAVLGRSFRADSVEQQGILEVMNLLQESFVISPWLLLIPACVIFLVIKKVPALPALTAGVLLGFLSQIFVQGGTVGDAVNTLSDGFVILTGNEMIDTLFNRGGIEAMMYTVSLTIVAMTFGGVLENTGMLKVIVAKILMLAKTAKGLLTTAISSAFFTNITAAEQYISIVIPGRMYVESFREKRLHPKNLSRAVEDGGTLTSVFVPWNTCAIFIFATLSVHPFEYGPYAIFNLIVPFISLLFAWTGFSIVKLTDQEVEQWKEKAKAM
ncbi:Na+/H+ antiporter NhaC [Halalkalibacterium halodurans]|jgi:NhaC family Na+:H+ antiporter|uniref:Sodium:proton antiporter n=2 Tax=Halalkalibacterium halodurans TaxID=86665 RepID=A0A0M0KGF9_ALKHA|nr:Na+/H+ antiporter NhaC [Halalkalibacterium halodurans]MDY7224464.1 Na+/H+ antiporter NhaC [Halalkalibacterium halodurans]MDY7243749.1 Na+/H+ antiporter NhaC [Halalkalibacterium halodurans]MED3645786.1 Na+/H+ antiporter NhaC [Halalkalibacterium halodurans]MED4123201.1 Na+/H+ antiporter NhaC [Halalkalibacterium halodurans]TPE69218.1 Na+/H+ antiporter NhaC [Halalkalibacterium halodurans]